MRVMEAGWTYARTACGAMGLRRLLAGLASSAALGLAAPAAAQGSASAEGRAVVHQPMTIFAGQHMDFGHIVTRGTPGTVTIVPNASQTCTVTGTLVRTGPCRAAIFSGYAGLLSTIRIERMPGNMLILTGPGGATMSVTNLTYTSDTTMIEVGSTPTHVQYYVIDLDGLYLVRVGGRLNVAAMQAPGVYNGNIVVQLNYN